MALKLDPNIITHTDKNENTVLHIAAAKGSASDVDVLFRAVADPHQKNKAGMTPLMLICGAKDIDPKLAIEKAKALLNAKAPANPKSGTAGDLRGFDWKKEQKASKQPRILIAYFAGKDKDFLNLLLEREPGAAKELFRAVAYQGDLDTLKFLMQGYRKEYDEMQTALMEQKPLSILLERGHISTASKFIKESGLDIIDNQFLFDACSLKKMFLIDWSFIKN